MGRLVGRSGESVRQRAAKADVAQLAERVLGKDEVTSSILVIGSSLRSALARRASARQASVREGCRAVAPKERRRTIGSAARTVTTCE